MFSEFDILEKEMTNDDYKFSCMIECACMEAEMVGMDDSAVVTEAEGDDVASKIKEKFAALKEKVKKIIDALKEKISEGMKKISNFFTTKKLKAEYEDLLKRAKEAEKTYGTVLAHNEKWQKYLEDKTIEMYDLEKTTTGIRRVSDFIIAGAKNIKAKITGGKKVTAEDVSELRRDAKKQLDEIDDAPKIKRIANIHDVVNMLAVGGVVGGLMKLAGAESATAIGAGAFVGTLATAATDIIEASANAVRSEAIKASASNFDVASGFARTTNESIGLAVASLGDIIVEAEMLSYRKAIKYLKHNLSVIDEIIKQAEVDEDAAAEYQGAAEANASVVKQFDKNK